MFSLDSHSMFPSDSHHVSHVLEVVPQFVKVRGFALGVSYNVVRPLYVSTSQPEITRISFEVTQPRVGVVYTCTVYVEGRTNITSNNSYNYEQLGSATSTATVTGE